MKDGKEEDISGAGKTSAWLKDWPSVSLATLKKYDRYYWELETCAVCSKGKDIGKVFSCLTWSSGIKYDAGKNSVSFYAQNASLSKGPSATFKEAVNLWNNEAGTKDSKLKALPTLK